MVIRAGEHRDVPRWLLLVVAIETTVIIGLTAGIAAAILGSTASQAVGMGFVVVAGCFSAILAAIGFLTGR